MFSRFVSLETSIRTTLALIDKPIEVLSPEEWVIAAEITTALQPMKEVTDHISGENYVTGSSIIILIQGILDLYNNMIEENPNFSSSVKLLINKLKEGLEGRLGNLQGSKTLVTATFLDPRFKNIAFPSEKIAETAKKNIINLVASQINQDLGEDPSGDTVEMSSDTPSTSSTLVKKLAAFNTYRRIAANYKPAGTPMSRAITEVQRYLEEPLPSENSDPLKWWREHSYNFPFLSKIVKQKFCTVVTSVPCERVFSKAGNILNERRTRLSSEKVKKLVFLKYNS
ncbi:unnamed protein product [Nezara viridula]|uniref:HAT C-terminal dimerisation domain-containing protein n=1 Tax=Nezara viridula TaxID=85310 RepID=A0A9P0MPL7_NEZVI|nr:unnamed protein product [Nezara viridula]